MKKVSELKVGMMAIYIGDDDFIKISTITSNKNGLIKLANGHLLDKDTRVYDSVEDAEKSLIVKLEADIKQYEADKLLAEAKIMAAKAKLIKLNRACG